MRTTIVRTMRCRGRRMHSPVAPAPDLCSARARGIGWAAASLTSGGLAGWLVVRPVRRGSSVAAAPAHMVVLRHPGGRPAVKIFPYLSIH